MTRLPFSLNIYKVEVEDRELYRFIVAKDDVSVAMGTASGFHSILDQALEAITTNVPNLIKGKPSSLTDLAFDSGVIAERARMLKFIEDNYQHTDAKYDPCLRCSMIAVLGADMAERTHND
jgi:hypothetical protein